MESIFAERLICYHALQDAFLRRREHRQPLVVEIEPTTGCTLQCVFCPRHRLVRPGENLTIAELARVLKNLGGPFPGSMLMFSGLGEPLAHPHILSFVRQAKLAGWFCGITTNGTLLTGETAGDFVAAGLDVLQISLHAATQETHQKISRGGSLAEVVAKVRSAIAACRDRVVLAMNYTMIPENRAETSAFASFWQHEGVTCINFSPGHSRGGALLSRARLQSGRSQTLDWPCWCRRHALFVTCQGELLACCNDLSGETRRGDLRMQALDSILVQESSRGQIPPHGICGGCDFSFRSPGSP